MLLNLFDTTPEIEREPELQTNFEIEAHGSRVPVRIVFEPRPNNRVSINKNGILIRISSYQNKNEQRQNIDKLLKWAKEKLDGKPQLLDTLPQRHYTNGEVLSVGDTEFVISVLYHDQNKSTAKIFKNNIVLQLAKGLTKEVQDNASSYLVAKCIAKHYQPIISQRISELNERFFKQQVKSVRLKYATSFWGHCSHDGNIVISVRLMFAPKKVIDYVLVHELAHLIHHNHSAQFWKVVEQIMPDYMQAEKHLKEFSAKYYL